jgi:hypothetical protein
MIPASNRKIVICPRLLSMNIYDYIKPLSWRTTARTGGQVHWLYVLPLMFLFMFSTDVKSQPSSDKYYYRIAHSKPSSKNDLVVTSLGVMEFQNNMIGQVRLNHVASDKKGDALALELSAGAAYSWTVSPYISLGIALGYSRDNHEEVAAYYPEAGIVVDITSVFGVTLSGKRYYRLHDEDEDVIMLGIVIRN